MTRHGAWQSLPPPIPASRSSHAQARPWWTRARHWLRCCARRVAPTSPCSTPATRSRPAPWTRPPTHSPTPPAPPFSTATRMLSPWPTSGRIRSSSRPGRPSCSTPTTTSAGSPSWPAASRSMPAASHRAQAPRPSGISISAPRRPRATPCGASCASPACCAIARPGATTTVRRPPAPPPPSTGPRCAPTGPPAASTTRTSRPSATGRSAPLGTCPTRRSSPSSSRTATAPGCCAGASRACWTARSTAGSRSSWWTTARTTRKPWRSTRRCASVRTCAWSRSTARSTTPPPATAARRSPAARCCCS